MVQRHTNNEKDLKIKKSLKKFFLSFFLHKNSYFFLFIYFLFGIGLSVCVWSFLLISRELFSSYDFIYAFLGILFLLTFLNIPRKYNKYLASLKGAVIALVLVSLILSLGTFVESFYGAFYAQKKIYHSFWALSVWVFLSLILIAVMRDRFPWKKKHVQFLTAHIGLLMIFLGSIVTQRYGVDGSLSLDVKEAREETKNKQKWIYLPERELSVYASLDGQNLREIKKRKVNFIGKDLGLTWSLGEYELKILDYIHHAKRKSQVKKASKKKGFPALQIELKNQNVHVLPWIILDRKKGFKTLDLGPAQVTLVSEDYDQEVAFSEKPHLLLRPFGETQVRYEIYKGNKKTKGVFKTGEFILTGWMDLKLRLMNYYPYAEQVVSYEPLKFEGGGPLSALKLSFDDKIYWLGLNSVLRVFTDKEVFFFSYGSRKLPLPFEMELEEFIIKNYPGSQKAKSYESLVRVEGFKDRVRIYMNNPLKHKGFTFYQASFERNKKGELLTSILSVNSDPGRFLKYYGSFLVIIGTLLLFYFRRLSFKQKKKGF